MSVGVLQCTQVVFDRPTPPHPERTLLTMCTASVSDVAFVNRQKELDEITIVAKVLQTCFEDHPQIVESSEADLWSLVQRWKAIHGIAIALSGGGDVSMSDEHSDPEDA